MVGDVSSSDHNYDLVNVGQVKWMLERALTELRFHSDSVSNQIEFVMDGIVSFDVPKNPSQEWTDDQYSPVTIGQLKALAQPFYNALGLTVPWDNEGSTDNFELANVGQLKHIFSFDLTSFFLE